MLGSSLPAYFTRSGNLGAEISNEGQLCQAGGYHA